MTEDSFQCISMTGFLPTLKFPHYSISNLDDWSSSNTIIKLKPADCESILVKYYTLII